MTVSTHTHTHTIRKLSPKHDIKYWSSFSLHSSLSPHSLLLFLPLLPLHSSLSPHSLTISRLLKVDVGVPEGPPGDLVAAHSDGDHWAGLAELLVQRGLVYFRVQVANVEGSDGKTGLARRGVHLGVFGT